MTGIYSTCQSAVSEKLGAWWPVASWYIGLNNLAMAIGSCKPTYSLAQSCFLSCKFFFSIGELNTQKGGWCHDFCWFWILESFFCFFCRTDPAKMGRLESYRILLFELNRLRLIIQNFGPFGAFFLLLPRQSWQKSSGFLDRSPWILFFQWQQMGAFWQKIPGVQW